MFTGQLIEFDMHKFLLLLVSTLMIASCGIAQPKNTDTHHQESRAKAITTPDGETLEPVLKTDEEWKKELTEMEYYVLRAHGTERAFTGDLLKNKDKGIYTCGACQLPLFKSETKFKSGTGWPSFYAPINETNVGEQSDNTYGMTRTEVYCNRCGGHLGHVFNDGPKPTGLRYCINSVSLDFEKE